MLYLDPQSEQREQVMAVALAEVVAITGWDVYAAHGCMHACKRALQTRVADMGHGCSAWALGQAAVGFPEEGPRPDGRAE